jgi:hypothetical protein
MRTILSAGIALAVVGIGLVLPGTAAAADTWSYQAALNPVTGTMVTGNGASWVSVTGTTAEVKIQVNGLVDGAPHAQTIRIDAQGLCPPAAGGSPSISITDGEPFYGTVGASLTTDGDSSPAAAVALGQFPSAGSYTYSRTIELDPAVVGAFRSGTAVLLVQGVDHNSNGSYDDVLGASEIDPNVPVEATDPALCGVLTASQMSGMPAGGVQTGGGSTAGVEDPGLLIGGGAAVLFGAALFGGALIGRRKLAGRAS